MQAQNLSDVPAILQGLSSSAWHFAITVVILAAFIALMLEALADLGLRGWSHKRALCKALRVDAKELSAIGIDGAMLRLGSDELAAQLAAFAAAAPAAIVGAPSEQPKLRRLLLTTEPRPLPSAGMSVETQQQAESLHVERQIDRLQVHLRAGYQQLEWWLAGLIGVCVVGLALANLWLSSVAALALTVLVPLASTLLAPMLRQILRSAMRRI